ncbi:hypothetical protein PAXINDRAFT_20623 [Paxillus involutus ATCC 200175]|uniref:Uncharacterized protein n=1 Tax=Paxillus involutus ATCC 200175 TaxID=664439 RepID=A0A0C9TG12_PAXIN|nr:hypothetical protein PAXINDRAFT_20623 [Paxillus involutus ATCC 200175]
MKSVAGQEDDKFTYQEARRVVNTNGNGEAREESRKGQDERRKPRQAHEQPGRLTWDSSRPPTSSPSLQVTQSIPNHPQPAQELEEAARRYLARRKREDGEGSRRGVESRDRGSREAVDEDSKDVHVHHANVEPQQPQTVGQTAVVDEAADTTDPHANSAGPAVPVGTTNGPPNESDGGRDRERGRNVEEEDEKGGRASESVALSSNDDGGDEDVRHAYIVPTSTPPSPNHVPPPPDESRPPPSVSLEGEMSGKQLSDHADEAATHHEHPRHESTTTPPIRTPRDEKSSREGRGTAMSHREAAGARDEVGEGNDGREMSYRVEETPNEVDGSDDAASTSYGVDDERSRRGGARDQATGDQEGQEVKETRMNEGEECRTSVQARSTTNIDGHGQYTPNEWDSPRTPPEPPPAFHPPSSPSSPNHPERPCNVDDTKSSKTAARTRADALHDPGGQTNSPGSKPPSVGLEGERIRQSSLHVEADDVETNDDCVENDHDTQQSPRRPVGMPDGDTRHPNGPTEPPDEEKGADGGYSEQEVESTVEHVETNEPGRVEVEEVEHVKDIESRESRRGDESRESRRGDEPRGRGGNGVETREVKGEERGQSECDGCQRDGRTNDTGDATSSASCDSLRVETGALAEHEDGQQQNGMQNVSTNVPTPPTPLPYDTNDPLTSRTHHDIVDASSRHLRKSAEPELQSDATETVRSYRGSVPKPPQSRTKGTEAHTSTPHTVDITHTRELPYRVITPA